MSKIVEKDKALSQVLADIEKQFGKGAIMKLGEQENMEVDVSPSGSISLDIALGAGGYPKGRIIEIYGPESSGKTTLAIHAVAEAQKIGMKAAYIDAENAFDREYAANLGVDVNAFKSWNNKIIQVGTDANAVYYKVNIISGGPSAGVTNYVPVATANDKIVPYLNLTNVSGTVGNKTFYIENLSDRYRVQLTQLYAQAKVVIDNNRVHLEDSPYDMFCIPYSDDLVIKKEGTNYCTANKSLALSIATAIGQQSGDPNIYDIQLSGWKTGSWMISGTA